MSSHTPSMFDLWSKSSVRAFDAAIEANRAMAAAFGVSVPDPTSTADSEPESVSVEDRLEPAENLPEWDVELQAGEELGVGDFVRFTKTLDERDVERFAAASGDTNPIHLDEEWAEETRFSGRIVHGTLAAGLISAALARLPGGVIYLSQDVEFQAPVRIGDRITAEVEIVEDLGGGRFRLRTTVVDDEESTVIDGEAVVLIDDVPN
ncbi:MaoC family dehydratase [Halorarius litoreus]|uniref:MaoC family dehydratase n=1 Tax=Halorarius litoreus TaxID=2962676 RepID=UPI0020CC0984|nr:MaoC family dehydratase [Halorarius litoreus]